MVSRKKKAKKIVLPSEVKVVGLVVLLFGALYVFQLITTPSFFKAQTETVTGLVVSNVESPVEKTPEPVPKQVVQPASQPAQSAPVVRSPGTAIRIVSPASGSTLDAGFTVKIEWSNDVLTCYYRVDDNGQLTWDRRMKPCKEELPVEAIRCKTGQRTCKVYVEGSDALGVAIGSETAYYSIK